VRPSGEKATEVTPGTFPATVSSGTPSALGEGPTPQATVKTIRRVVNTHSPPASPVRRLRMAPPNAQLPQATP
jgi:hypothetical protein